MVPAVSIGIPPVPTYSGSTYGSPRFVYGALTLYGRPSQAVPLARVFRSRCPSTPPGPRPRRFGLLRFRSPLPAESLLFSSPAATEMFQFTAFALRFSAECRAFSPAGSPIRISADLRPFAPPRGFSQLVTSFLASKSLGIPRTPFFSSFTQGTSRRPVLVSSMLHSVNELFRLPSPNGLPQGYGSPTARFRKPLFRHGRAKVQQFF